MITTRHQCTLRAALAVALSAAAATAVGGSAGAEGPNMSTLAERGWTCVGPHFGRTVCFPPAQTSPLADPTPNTSYTMLTFDLVTGDFLGTGHMIRGDLYRGQKCGPDGEAYTHLPLAGYYQCFHS